MDELGELPIELQPKLLRALAERQVKRVGGNAFEPIDVRVLAATRRDLGAEMNAGRFRSDLFFRIAQVRVELPPLRERLADLPLLVEDICTRVGAPEHAKTVEQWIELRMGSHDWPGNVRELVNVASVAATLADTPDAIDDVLTLARDTPAEVPQQAADRLQRGEARGDQRVRARLLHEPLAHREGERERDGAAERHGAPPRARVLAKIRDREGGVAIAPTGCRRRFRTPGCRRRTAWPSGRGRSSIAAGTSSRPGSDPFRCCTAPRSPPRRR